MFGPVLEILKIKVICLAQFVTISKKKLIVRLLASLNYFFYFLKNSATQMFGPDFYHTCTLSYDITMLRVMYVNFFYTLYNWAKHFLGELVCIFLNPAGEFPSYVYII